MVKYYIYDYSIIVNKKNYSLDSGIIYINGNYIPAILYYKKWVKPFAVIDLNGNIIDGKLSDNDKSIINNFIQYNATKIIDSINCNAEALIFENVFEKLDKDTTIKKII